MAMVSTPQQAPRLVSPDPQRDAGQPHTTGQQEEFTALAAAIVLTTATPSGLIRRKQMAGLMTPRPRAAPSTCTRRWAAEKGRGYLSSAGKFSLAYGMKPAGSLSHLAWMSASSFRYSLPSRTVNGSCSTFTKLPCAAP